MDDRAEIATRIYVALLSLPQEEFDLIPYQEEGGIMIRKSDGNGVDMPKTAVSEADRIMAALRSTPPSETDS